MILSVCGKGGVGKTTVSAVAAQALAARDGTRALIVDADPAGAWPWRSAWRLERRSTMSARR